MTLVEKNIGNKGEMRNRELIFELYCWEERK